MYLLRVQEPYQIRGQAAAIDSPLIVAEHMPTRSALTIWMRTVELFHVICCTARTCGGIRVFRWRDRRCVSVSLGVTTGDCFVRIDDVLAGGRQDEGVERDDVGAGGAQAIGG